MDTTTTDSQQQQQSQSTIPSPTLEENVTVPKQDNLLSNTTNLVSTTVVTSSEDKPLDIRLGFSKIASRPTLAGLESPLQSNFKTDSASNSPKPVPNISTETTTASPVLHKHRVAWRDSPQKNTLESADSSVTSPASEMAQQIVINVPLEEEQQRQEDVPSHEEMLKAQIAKLDSVTNKRDISSTNIHVMGQFPAASALLPSKLHEKRAKKKSKMLELWKLRLLGNKTKPEHVVGDHISIEMPTLDATKISHTEFPNQISTSISNYSIDSTLQGQIDDPNAKTKPSKRNRCFACFDNVRTWLRKTFKDEKQEISESVKLQVYRDMTQEDKNEVKSLILDLGYALARYNLPAHRLEYYLTRVANYYQLDSYYYSTPTGLFFSFGGKIGDPQASLHLVRIEGASINLDKVCKCEKIAHDIFKGRVTIANARKRIEGVVASSKHTYGHKLFPPQLVSIFMYFLCSTVFATFFEATWPEIIAAAISGLVVGVLDFISAKVDLIQKGFSIIAAVLVSIVAIACNMTLSEYGRVNVLVITLSGIIWQLPGLTFVVSIMEIANRHVVSGTSRLALGFSTAFQLGFGVLIGVKISTLFPLTTKFDSIHYSTPLWVYPIVMPFVHIAFAYMLQLPKNWLAHLFSFIAINGCFYTSYFGATYLGSELGSFCASFVCGIVAAVFGKASKHPPFIISTISVIMIVPGSVSLRGIRAFLLGDTLAGIQFLFSAIIVSLSIAVGLLFSNLLIPFKQKLTF